MVDPNRKINRFTDRDIEFLEECEREFSSRYSENDSEFMEHCAKPLDDPPILENCLLGGSGSSGGHQYQQHRSGKNPYPKHQGVNSGWRGHGRSDGGGNRNYRKRRGGRNDQNGYDHRDKNPRQDPYAGNRPPMNIRRDYSNFVAASKED